MSIFQKSWSGIFAGPVPIVVNPFGKYYEVGTLGLVQSNKQGLTLAGLPVLVRPGYYTSAASGSAQVATKTIAEGVADVTKAAAKGAVDGGGARFGTVLIVGAAAVAAFLILRK